MKRRTLVISLIILSLLLLFGVLRYSLTTDFVRDRVRSFAENQIEKSTGFKTNIGRIKGDLLRDFSIEDLRLFARDSAMVSVDSIHMKWSWVDVIAGKANITFLALYQPRVNLSQAIDNKWNVESDILFPQDDSLAESKGDFQLPVAISIDTLQVVDGFVAVRSLPNPLLNQTHEQINLTASGSFDEETYAVILKQLRFTGDLDALAMPFNVALSGKGVPETIDLNELVIRAGESLLSAVAQVSLQDSIFTFGLETNPIKGADWTSELANGLRNEKIVSSLRLSGSATALQFGLSMESPNLNHLQLDFSLANYANPHVRSLRLSGNDLNLSALLNNDELPRIGSLDVQAEADLRFDSLYTSSGQIRAQTKNIVFLDRDVHIDSVFTRHELFDRVLTSQLIVRADSQSADFTSSLRLDEKRSDELEWTSRLQFRGIRPFIFSQDSLQIRDVLNGEMQAAGKGIWFPDNIAVVEMVLHQSRYDGQAFSRLEAEAKLENREGILNGNLTLEQSSLAFNSTIELSNQIRYRSEISADNFNLAEINQLQELPSKVNVRATLVGEGTRPEDLNLAGSFIVFNSLVNGETIEQLTASIFVQDTLLVLTDGRLNSSFARGQVEGERFLLQRFDPRNSLSFNLELLDGRILTPFVGAEQFNTKGNLEGEVRQITDDQLGVSVILELKDVYYDGLSIDVVKGNLSAAIKDSALAFVDVEIQDPKYGSINLRNFKFTSELSYANKSLNGNFGVKIEARKNLESVAQGSLFISPDSSRIVPDYIQINTPKRTLKLQEPFQVYYTDTLFYSTPFVLSDGGNTSISGDVFFKQNGQKAAELTFENILIETFQELFLEQALAKGTLNGLFFYGSIGDSFELLADATVRGFEYQGIKMDSLYGGFRSSDKLIGASAFGFYEGYRIADIDVKMPTANNRNADSLRFGTIALDMPNLNFMRDFITAQEIGDIDAAIKLKTGLSYISNEPKIETSIEIRNARLNNIVIDSVIAGAEYQHQGHKMEFAGGAYQLGQELGLIAGQIPFHFDDQTLTLNLPDQKDSLAINMRTDGFNLEVINPFLARYGLSHATGNMTGFFDVSGTLDEPDLKGEIYLNQGGITQDNYQIQLRNAELNLVVNDSSVVLESLNVSSGRGILAARGQLNHTFSTIEDFDFTIGANQLNVANAPETKAWITSDIRVHGTPDSPKISGDLSFDEMRIFLSNFGTASIENVELEDENAIPFSVWDSATVDLNIKFPERLGNSSRKNLLLNRSNPELKFELTGNLNARKKKNEELQLFGNIDIKDGEAKQFNRKFDVTEGRIDFIGEADNPDLDIQTLYTIKRDDINIYFHIGGNVEKPEFTYESEPVMETQDIVSYLLFNRPFAALMGWQQGVASSSTDRNNSGVIKDLATDLLMERASAVAGDRLGLDIVEIDNSDRTTGSGTTIKAGKYLNDRMLIAVIQQLGSGNTTTQFTLEYLLRKNLQLILTQSEDSRTGVDVLWKYDY